MQKTIADYKSDPRIRALAAQMAPAVKANTVMPDICDYLEREYYVQDEATGFCMPITLLPHQKTILRFMFSFVINWRQMIFSTVKKSGKCLSIYTKIPTPKGFTTMEDLKVGDEVFDEHDNVCTVTFATDSLYDHECYEVVFSDGSVLIADRDHRWVINGNNESDKQLVTTSQMLARLWKTDEKMFISYSNGRYVKSIRLTDSHPVKCIQVDSPSHLYLAGETRIPTHNTTIAGAVARYVAEFFGPRNEVICLANDLEQARGRIYKSMCDSIELNPEFDRSKSSLPGRWRIIQRDATCITNGTVVRAVSTDYKGEAGSNPTLTLYSELWGYSSEISKRLWAELTPVPTRKRSFRFIETYAGYSDESEILIELYEKVVKQGRRLTHAELEPYGGWPFEDQPPIYVNEEAAAVAYWDDGEIARRMPWQSPEYYASEYKNLSLSQYERLHLNWWTESVNQFAPVEWWNRLARPEPEFALSRHNELRLGTSLGIMPGDNRPIVLAGDASVTGDCTALTGWTRHPDDKTKLAQVYCMTWQPTREHPMNYTQTIEAEIRYLCANYNVVQFCYDPYQLHKLGTDLRDEAICWTKPFNQGIDREKADYQFYTMVRDKNIEHMGDSTMEEHFRNAGVKMSQYEDTKLRIVKRTKDKHIDAVVASSMAASECRRLNLW